MTLDRTSAVLKSAQGRVVGYTETGPIFLQPAVAIVLPIPVALRNLQELSARSNDPEAKVYGSQAKRSGSRQAQWIWAIESGLVASSIASLPPAARLRFLSTVLKFSRSQDSTDGLEAVIAAAVNGAWPWLARDGAREVFDVALVELRKSGSAKRDTLAVYDPVGRSVSYFERGQIFDVDPTRAMIDNYVHMTPNFGPPMPGELRPEFLGGFGFGRGRAGSDMFGGFGGNPGGPSEYGSRPGIGEFGGLPGAGSHSDPGADWGLGFGSPGAEFGIGRWGQNTALGQQGIGGMGGHMGLPGLGGGLGNPTGLGGYVGGPFTLGPGGMGSKIGGPSGLSAPGGDVADGYDNAKIVGRGMQALGVLLAGGSAIAVSSGVGAPAAIGLAVEGAIAGFIGTVIVDKVDEARRQEDKAEKKAAPASGPAVVVAPAPADSEDEPEQEDDEPEDDPEPEGGYPNPEEYPNPDSIGGHDYYPNPDGTGGGSPRSLGAVMASVSVVTGPGLSSRMIQTGPQSVAIM